MRMKGSLGEPMPGMIEAMLDPEFEPPDVAARWRRNGADSREAGMA